MKIIAFDLSLAATGIARYDGVTETLSTRLRGIERIEAIVDSAVRTGVYDADLVVMEDALFGMRNHTTGELLMLHGCIRLALHREGVHYAVIAPATLKKYATGAGNAKKPDMRMELYKRAGIDLADDNQVDAWWLRAAALDHYGEPPVPMPQANRDALGKVDWPELVAT